MQKKLYGLQLTAQRWNYLIASLFFGLFASVITIFLLQSMPSTKDILFFALCILTSIFLACSSLYCFIKAVFPTKIKLTKEGIELTYMKKLRFISWSNYKGLRGGPALIMDYWDHDGVSKSLPIGIWEVNLEVTIHDFAKSHHVDVPIRQVAYDQVSIAPLIVLAVALTLFAFIVAIYGISQNYWQ